MILRQVGHIVHGRILVHHAVHIAVKAVAGGIDAGERHHARENIRPAEVEIGRMGGTQAAAKGDDARILAAGLTAQRLHEGRYLMENVAHPRLMTADAVIRIAVFIRPGLQIDGVDGGDHDLAAFDPRCQRVAHAIVFKGEKAAILTGHEQQRASCVTVDLALHFSPQRRAVFLKISCLHSFFLLVIDHLSTPYSSVGMTKGSCFSQLASLCSPPGMIRLVRYTSLSSRASSVSRRWRRISGWLSSSREP